MYSHQTNPVGMYIKCRYFWKLHLLLLSERQRWYPGWYSPVWSCSVRFLSRTFIWLCGILHNWHSRNSKTDRDRRVSVPVSRPPCLRSERILAAQRKKYASSHHIRQVWQREKRIHFHKPTTRTTAPTGVVNADCTAVMTLWCQGNLNFPKGAHSTLWSGITYAPDRPQPVPYFALQGPISLGSGGCRVVEMLCTNEPFQSVSVCKNNLSAQTRTTPERRTYLGLWGAKELWVETNSKRTFHSRNSHFHTGPILHGWQFFSKHWTVLRPFSAWRGWVISSAGRQLYIKSCCSRVDEVNSGLQSPSRPSRNYLPSSPQWWSPPPVHDTEPLWRTGPDSLEHVFDCVGCVNVPEKKQETESVDVSIFHFVRLRIPRMTNSLLW